MIAAVIDEEEKVRNGMATEKAERNQ